MQIYNKKLYFYKIDLEYIKYLHSIDNEVYYDETDENYDNKPYLGIILTDNDFKYFVPLTSAKKKHITWPNSGDNYIMIYEKVRLQDTQNINTENWISKFVLEGDTFVSKHILSILDIKKMIPVPDRVFHKENINLLNDEKRKRLLLKEHEFLVPMQDKIVKKANKIYTNQMKTKKIFKGYCNYTLLENSISNYEVKML